MVRIRPERYPPGTVKKLHARSAGPFKILKKINSNAYVVDLLPDFSIIPSFNIEDLIAYKGPNFSPDNHLLDEPSHEPISERPLLPPLPQIHLTHMAEQIDEIIDDQMSLLEKVVTTDFWFVGKDYQILITLGLIERNSNVWTLIVWSIMRAEEAHIRQSRVFSNPGERWGYLSKIMILHQEASHSFSLVRLGLGNSSYIRLFVLILFSLLL